ncbi:MAG: hypothetical protein ABEJ04_02495 [Halobacteriaceae archaeon]
MSEDRAVSESLGFVIIFSIIVTTVGLTYTLGMTELNRTRTAEHLNNAERAFDVLAGNADDIVHGGVPSRATEVKLRDANVYLGDPVTVNVSGHATGDPNDNFSVEYDLRPVVYESAEGSRLVYSQGAVFRSDGGTIMVVEPNFVLGDGGVAVPIVQTRATSAESVGGSTTVLVRMALAEQSVLVSRTSDTYALNVTIDSPRHAAWREYFRSRGMSGCELHGTAVSCEETGVEHLYVSVSRVDVEFA